MKKTNTFFTTKQFWTTFLVAIGLLFFLGSENTVMGQIVIDTEAFDNTTNITLAASTTFCGGDNSGGCSTSANVFNLGETCNSFTGGTGAYFWGQDTDACTTGSPSFTISMAVPAGVNAPISFSGLFAASLSTSAGYDAGDGATIQYSINAGTPVLGLTVAQPGTDNLAINGTNLSTSFQSFGFDIGSNLAGSTIEIIVTYNGLNSGAEGLALDEFQLMAVCGITPLGAIAECTSDGVYQVTVPYIGSESAAVNVINNAASGSVTFDPTVVDGSIVVSGINDTDNWDFVLTGGNCSETFSGTAPNCFRPTCPPITPPVGTGITVSSCFTDGNTSQSGQDAAADADATLNTPYGTWAGAVNRAEIDGITLITFDTGYYISDNSVPFAFGADNVILPAIANLEVYGNGSVIEQAVGGTQVSFIMIDGVNNITINDFNFINFDKTLGSIAYIEDATGIVFNNITVDGSDRGGDAFHITASAEDTEVTFYCSEFYNHFSHNPPNSVMTIVGDGSTNEGSHTVTANFVDTEWRCNNRNGFGGALTITGGDNATPGPNVNIWGGVFSDNVANATDAGAIYASGDTNLFIDGTEFICNSNTSNDGSGGGALFVGDDSNLTILNANFSNNVSRLDGGAITFNGSGELRVEGTQFHNNIATGGAGGGIFYRGKNAVTTAAALVNNCYFNGNTDGIYFEGVGNLSPMNLTISNTTITGSLGRGVAIESSDSDEDFVTVVGSVLCGNTGADLDQNFEPSTLTVDAYSAIGTGDVPQNDCNSTAASLGYQGSTPEALACGTCLIEATTATAACDGATCEDCFTDTCNSSQQTDTDWATILPAAGTGALGAGDCNAVTTTTTQVDVANFSFTPNNPTVKLGDQVDFNWVSGNHNVNFIDNGNTTATTDAWDFATVTGTTGINHSIIADVTGAYAFQCDPHSGGMTATLTVEPLIFCSEFTLAAADVPMYFTADAKFDFTGTCDPTATHSIQQENGDGVTCDMVTPLYDNANNTGNNTANPVYYMTTAGTYTHCITITALGGANCAIANVCPARVTSCGSCDLATCNNDYQVGYDEFNPATPSATSLQADNACNTITPMLTTTGDQTTICTTYSPTAAEAGYTGIGTSLNAACAGSVSLNTVVSNNTANGDCNDITTSIPNDNGFPVYDLADGSTYEICVTATLTADCDLSELCIAPYGFASISGTAFYDDESTGDIQGDGTIDGVTVTLFDSGGNQIGLPIMTDTNGDYTFDNLPNGNYYVAFTTPSGYGITTVNPNPFSTTDANNSDIDATGTTPTFALNDVDITDIDAGYINGSLAGTVFTDANGNGLDDDFDDISGVEVQLFTAAGVAVTTNADGTAFGIIMTDGVGDYIFENLLFGDYYVVFSNLPVNNVFTTQDANSNGNDATDSDAASATGQTGDYTLNAATPNVTDVDAGIFDPMNISGTVFIDTDMDGTDDDGASPSTPVTVTLIDSSTGSAAVGFPPLMTTSTYSFTDVPPGSYYVTFSTPTGTTITTPGTNSSTITDLTDVDDSDIDNTGRTPTFTVASGDPDVTDVDAGFQPQAATIGDFTFIDLDNDGIYNNNDVPMAGVTVELYDATTDTAIPAYSGANAQTTDAAGAYSFTGVSAGDYYVVFTTPAGYAVTAAGTGNDQNNITGNTGVGSTNDFSFDGTTNNLTLDAGFVGTGSIGDFVWEDTNGNGLQDEVGTGIDGVTMTLTWFGPNGVAGGGDDVVYPTQNTAGGGAYNFTGLPMGNFNVAVTANTPSGILTASPPTIITLTDAAPIVDTADFGYQPAANCNPNVGSFPNN